MSVFIKQQRYAKKYSKILVTYHDDVTKVFTPFEWAIHEEKVTPIAKNIEWLEHGQKLTRPFKWTLYLWVAIGIILAAIIFWAGLHYGGKFFGK